MEHQGFGVHLKVADFDASRKFYESLGFKPVFSYGSAEHLKTLPEGLASAPEKYRGMTFEVGNSNFEIAEGHVGLKNNDSFKEIISSPKVSAMVRVDSLEPLFTNPLVNITFPVRHYYWGTIEAAFRDPDGFVLVFIAPYSEIELERVKQHVEVEEFQA